MLDPIDIPLRWIGILCALFLIALASAAEASLSMISRRQLNALHTSSRANLVHALINDAYRFKVSVLLLNTIGFIVTTALVVSLLEGLQLYQEILWIVVMTIGIILFAEALPKAIALRNPSETARFIAGPFYFLTIILRPISMLIDFMARRVFGLSGKEVLTPIVTEEELLTIVNVGEEEGVIQPEEREMIEDIITFGDTIVREVMTPRVDVVAISANAPFNEALALVTTHGHSRIPVYRESNDRIIGLLYAKDLLLGMRYGNTDFVVAEMMRAPYYVPEMINIGVLLKTMQARRVHFAVVVDEYGSTTGIITLEDILEEIVGEINDEYDQNRDPDVVWNGDGDVVVDARLLLDDVNDLTGLALHSETSDRIGGFVTEQLGRMSQLNDEIEIDGATMTVVAMNGIRMSRIRIVYTAKQGGKGDSSNQPLATD